MAMNKDYDKIKIFTFSSKVIFSGLVGYSITSFYLGITLALSSIVRPMFIWYTYGGFIGEIN